MGRVARSERTKSQLRAEAKGLKRGREVTAKKPVALQRKFNAPKKTTRTPARKRPLVLAPGAGYDPKRNAATTPGRKPKPKPNKLRVFAKGLPVMSQKSLLRDMRRTPEYGERRKLSQRTLRREASRQLAAEAVKPLAAGLARKAEKEDKRQFRRGGFYYLKSGDIAYDKKFDVGKGGRLRPNSAKRLVNPADPTPSRKSPESVEAKRLRTVFKRRGGMAAQQLEENDKAAIRLAKSSKGFKLRGPAAAEKLNELSAFVTASQLRRRADKVLSQPQKRGASKDAQRSVAAQRNALAIKKDIGDFKGAGYGERRLLGDARREMKRAQDRQKRPMEVAGIDFKGIFDSASRIATGAVGNAYDAVTVGRGSRLQDERTPDLNEMNKKALQGLINMPIQAVPGLYITADMIKSGKADVLLDSFVNETALGTLLTGKFDKSLKLMQEDPSELISLLVPYAGAGRIAGYGARATGRVTGKVAPNSKVAQTAGKIGRTGGRANQRIVTGDAPEGVDIPDDLRFERYRSYSDNLFTKGGQILVDKWRAGKADSLRAKKERLLATRDGANATEAERINKKVKSLDRKIRVYDPEIVSPYRQDWELARRAATESQLLDNIRRVHVNDLMARMNEISKSLLGAGIAGRFGRKRAPKAVTLLIGDLIQYLPEDAGQTVASWTRRRDQLVENHTYDGNGTPSADQVRQRGLINLYDELLDMPEEKLAVEVERVRDVREAVRDIQETVEVKMMNEGVLQEKQEAARFIPGAIVEFGDRLQRGRGQAPTDAAVEARRRRRATKGELNALLKFVRDTEQQNAQLKQAISAAPRRRSAKAKELEGMFDQLLAMTRERDALPVEKTTRAPDYASTADAKVLNEVGKAVKSADPDTVKMLRREGGKTGNRAVAEYVRGADPEQFNRVVADLIDEGKLPEQLPVEGVRSGGARADLNAKLKDLRKAIDEAQGSEGAGVGSARRKAGLDEAKLREAATRARKEVPENKAAIKQARERIRQLKADMKDLDALADQKYKYDFKLDGRPVTVEQLERILTDPDIADEFGVNPLLDPVFVSNKPGVVEDPRSFYLANMRDPRAKYIRSGESFALGNPDTDWDSIVASLRRGLASSDAAANLKQTLDGNSFGLLVDGKSLADVNQTLSELKQASGGVDWVALNANMVTRLGESLNSIAVRMAGADGFSTGDIDDLAKAVSDATLKGSDFDGGADLAVIAVPATMWRQFELLQGGGRLAGSKIMDGLAAAQAQFKKTVLPLSPTFYAGNIIENNLRVMIAGGLLNPRTWADAAALLRRILAEPDPVKRQELSSQMFPAQLMRSVDAQAISTRSERAVNDTPVVGDLVKFWNEFTSYTRTINELFSETGGALRGGKPRKIPRGLGGVPYLSVGPTMLAAARAHRRAITEMNDEMGDFGYLSSKALAEQAVGNVQKSLEYKLLAYNKIQQIMGAYDGQLAEVKQAQRYFLPFLDWAKNALIFVAYTFPVKHPFLFSTLYTLEQVVQEELQANENYLIGGSGNPDELPLYLRAGIALPNGERLNLTRFTPFAVGAENPFGLLMSSLGGPFQGAAALNILGVDWKGNKLYETSGGELGVGGQVEETVNLLLQGLVPGYSQVGRAVRKGGKPDSPGVIGFFRGKDGTIPMDKTKRLLAMLAAPRAYDPDPSGKKKPSSQMNFDQFTRNVINPPQKRTKSTKDLSFEEFIKQARGSALE